MKLKPLFGLLVLPLAVSSAWAEGESSNFTFSGFGTAAATRSNTDQAEFGRPNQAAGATKSFDYGVDSLLGLQGSYKLTPSFSATVQGLVRKNATDSFKGELAWAFAKYKVSDALSVRLGRVGLPVYLISDYRNVGYANTMLRPPVELYAQAPLESIDGGDIVYQGEFGETTFTAQLAYGGTKPDLVGRTATFRQLSSFNLVAENGPFTFRFGRAEAHFDVNAPGLDMLVGILNKAGLTTAANSLAINDANGSFTALGFGLNWKNIVVQSEFAKRKTSALSLTGTTSWYTMFGYRFGKFLPYFNHTSSHQDSPRTVAGIPPIAALKPLQAAADSVVAGAMQTSNSIGLRWDFHDSAALKVQFDRFSPDSGTGFFINPKPGFTGPVNVIAVGVDFVF